MQLRGNFGGLAFCCSLRIGNINTKRGGFDDFPVVITVIG